MSNTKKELAKRVVTPRVNHENEWVLDVAKFAKYFTEIKMYPGGYPGATYEKLCNLWELVKKDRFVSVVVTIAGEITAYIVCQLDRIVVACVPTKCLFRVK